MADLIAAGDQSGWVAFNRAAMPLMCGVAMEVPEAMLKFAPMLGVGPGEIGHAARIFTPGAMMSGLSMLGSAMLGPLEEKEAIMGDGVTPNNVPLKAMVAVGAEAVLMYDFMISPSR
ncbi:hypothetical protein DsansV1_C29g0210401 [Dioscorea sansibarensis]